MERAPLRVALLSYRSLSTCGGQGIYLRYLSRELTALGHRVTVFSGQPYPVLDEGVSLVKLPSLDLYRDDDPFRWPKPSEIRDGADLVEFAMMRTGQFSEPLGFSMRAWKSLRPGDDGPPPFDVIHDNQGLGYGMLPLARALRPYGIPVVATIHHPITVDRRLDLAAARGIRKRFGLRRWYSFLPMQARVARRISAIATPSDSSTEDLARDMGVDLASMSMIPLGTDHEVFRPGTAPPVPGRMAVVTSADVPLKGLFVLLEALAKLRVERPQAHLVCVGKARPGGAAAGRVADLGLGDAVTFSSGLTEAALVELLQSAEVAVVPSLYEGFSLPAVEEMACGLPLVATTAGALPEVVGRAGEAGLLVPPGDAEALAAALARLLDDPRLRAKLGTAGRQRVEQRYSWRVAAAGTAEWYRDAIASARATATKIAEHPGRQSAC